MTILFSAQFAKAETINCGLKTITVNNGKIEQIRHEDGSIHRDSSVSDNWSYDGKSIKHKLLDERIKCGSKPKSREEIVSELSSRFTRNPNLHGMSKQEAGWMTKYTANLMNNDKSCHLLVDASKSVQRKGMFYIDCNDPSGSSHRYWVSGDDLRAGNTMPAATPVNETAAINTCNDELRLKVVNPTTYKPSLLTGTTSRVVKSTGRNIVEINFSSKNAMGQMGEFRGKCIMESGRLIEATVENR